MNFVAAALLACVAPASARGGVASSETDIRADVAVLADDRMAGRDPSRREYAAAVAHVVARFRAVGLVPWVEAPDYRRPVPLVRYAGRTTGAATWTPAGGTAQPLLHGRDWFPLPDPAVPRVTRAAPVVYVGHGLSVPPLGLDDYAGLDVRGRIVVVDRGGPGRLTGDERGILWEDRAKRVIAAAKGAVGMIVIEHDEDPQAPAFSTSAAVAMQGGLGWARAGEASNLGPADLPLLGTLSEAGARRVFGGDWRVRGIVTAAGTLSVSSATQVTAVPSVNVVGLLPGADPVLAHEIVVVSAHLDHLGATGSASGEIAHGALDNAMGVAGMIDVARRLAGGAQRPRRTLMFVATTAEESGLIGADAFVHDPATPVAAIVADINLDMPILTYRFEDMIAYGADHSSLGPRIASVLSRHGLPLSPDPAPGEGEYLRADQYSFARRGIPGILLWPGRKGAGAAATQAFFDRRYHRPADNLAQPIAWDQANRFFAIAAEVVRAVADDARAPRWNPRDRVAASAAESGGVGR